MKNRILVFLSGLACVVAALGADQKTLAVSIAVPVSLKNDTRAVHYVDRNSHFHVLITNVSNGRQRVFLENSSWGYGALGFELTDEAGQKWTANKRGRFWVKNSPAYCVLDPGEGLVLDVYYGDSEVWEGFSRLKGGAQTVTMRAVFAVRPDSESTRLGVWTGSAVSEPRTITFFFPAGRTQ